MSLEDLVAALDDESGESSSVSSVRQPQSLRRALAAAIEMGLINNANEAMNQGLRAYLESLALQAALDAVFEAHPKARPTLAETAVALAELDHHPLAHDITLIQQAAAEVTRLRPGADADDVLLWAESLHLHQTARLRRA